MNRLQVLISMAATTGLLAGAALVWRGSSSDASATPQSAEASAAITATAKPDHARRAFQLAALAPDLAPDAVDASLDPDASGL